MEVFGFIRALNHGLFRWSFWTNPGVPYIKNAFNVRQEIAMYFDKLTRRHNVRETLNLARTLFAQYLTDDWKREAKNDIHNKCQDIADAATI